MSTTLEPMIPLPVLFFVWYASSVMCTTTSKVLVSTAFPSAYWLSLAQFVIATGVGSLAVRFFNEAPPAALPAGKAGRQLRREVWVLSLVFALGMLALNKGYEVMHVSLVETLRATEPVVSSLLTMALMPAEAPGCARIVSLLPIVMGACCSSIGAADCTALGLSWVAVSNVCFSLRTIQYKQIRQRYHTDEWNLFYHICRMGTVYQLLFALAGDAGGLLALLEGLQSMGLGAVVVLLLALVNGVMYYTYLQSSWVILMRVSVVSHAVGNSMRRPVVLICNVLYFGNAISYVNAAGICMAFTGVLVYSRLKATSKGTLKI